MVKNDDRPGVIGIVGTLLGKDKVNIADMSLSRLTPGGDTVELRSVHQTERPIASPAR